jgi:hypothetical protein
VIRYAGSTLSAGGQTMTVKAYRQRAEEVEKLAKDAISEAHKEAMLRIAREWRELADQREEYNRRFLGGSTAKRAPGC